MYSLLESDKGLQLRFSGFICVKCFIYRLHIVIPEDGNANFGRNVGTALSLRLNPES
jgi:hypothetical protein